MEERIEEMAYETKVILIALAKLAIFHKSKPMYKEIADMANAEGVVLKPYEEAKEEQQQ